MSYRNELNSYIARLWHRLRFGAWVRGAALFAGTALLATVALVLILNRFAFPVRGVTLARGTILAALAAAASFGLILPIRRLTQAFAVRRAETLSPALGHRLTTFLERNRQESNPFLELLAADTLAHTQDANPAMLVPGKSLFALGGAGLACLVVLVWMIVAAPGYLGYGASLLWTGPGKNVAPLYAITVTPGDVTVRRNSDQLITASVKGMQPNKAQLFAHYQSSGGWEPVTMEHVPNSASAATWQFIFAGLPENVEYYVLAGPLVSPHYKVRVVDLPSVKAIQVTYHYPAWTGMKSVTERDSGDLRAIEGTDAAVQIKTDRPLKDGQFVMDGGQTIHLTASAGNVYQGSIHMQKDGAYHLAATDEGQPVRLSEDYFIATDKAAPPDIAIQRPGGDYRASPIEEVTVGVQGSAEFGLKEMHLHYSVNGGADRDISLLKTPGAKTADGSYTLPMEDFKLTPGDLVSIYATAKDGHAESRTDISFIQVDPFEREFSQSQQAGGGGGGGGGGNNQTEISKRQKELIAATWKQQNDKTATASSSAAQGQFLSDAQQKLRDQLNALSVRMQSRDISEANQEFTDFDKDMQAAGAAMIPAADKLKSTDWKGAMPLEQKALQALLRAEATFRKIQVAFGQRGGGGGGGGENAGRDLASLFDLELDTAKNQYETAQNTTPAEQHEKDVEDTLAKLDALAKRQEDLANQQKNPQQAFQERWQQEMLRREAEQLQHQLEQLAQNNQSSSGSQSGQTGQQSSSASQSNSNQQSSSGAQSSSGSQTASNQRTNGSAGSQSSRGASGQSSDQRIEQAMRRLQQATQEMKRNGGIGQSNNSAQEAAQQLHEASKLLAGTQHDLASNKMDAFAHEANRIRQQERTQAGQINQLASDQDQTNITDLSAMMARRRQLTQLAEDRQQLSNNLSTLQRNLRDAEREMASNQPQAAQNVRDALKQMDDSDLDNRMQRSADWLRRGINPNSNGTEDQIAQGLSKLSQQLQQAQKAMGQGGTGQQQGAGEDKSALLGQVERLRNQIESMARLNQNGQAGVGGRTGQNQQAQLGRNGGPVSGYLGNRNVGDQSGNVRYGGARGADGTVWNNINTGNNRYGPAGPRPAPLDASANPADTEKDYRSGMRELNQLRGMVKDDPQAAKDIADLTRQMQHLDPSRFPGNPAMVEQMHQEVLSSINRLELQLQREGVAPEARTKKPDAIPAGYQDSVAEYYRRLSKNQ